MRPGAGNCRLLAALTHELAKQLAVYARAMAEPAETVARLIAGSRPGCIDLATPLSRGNTAARQVRGERGAERQPVTVATPAPSCRICGVKLADKSRQLCPSCWPVTRNKIAAERVKAANAARGQPCGPPEPIPPTHWPPPNDRCPCRLENGRNWPGSLARQTITGHSSG
jgi:hypothetical protein